MSITNYTAYKQNVANPRQVLGYIKATVTVSTGLIYSTWGIAGDPGAGADPTVAAVPTRTTLGALGQSNSSGVQRFIRSVMAVNGVGLGHLVVADRLSHQAGLDGTVTTAQTTNLPTAALTRQTSGVGVQLGLEIYTNVGATATTATCSYTNSAGTSGQTTIVQQFGGTGYRTASRIIPIPLASGDVGVKAVASVTLLATTGTAGSFGVTLYKPVISIPLGFVANFATPCDEDVFYNGGWFPTVDDNACLFGLVISNSGTTGPIQGNFSLSED